VRRAVKDAEFRLAAQKNGTLALESLTEKKTLPAIRYEISKPFAAPFGIRLTLKAAPEEGDTFHLVTRQPQDYDFAVHDGLVLTPTCRAIELVTKDKALDAVYGRRAGKLLSVIEAQLIPKWEKYGRETKEGGVYVNQEDLTTLPHNQYLPLGTVQIALYRITGNPAYKERATKIAAFFKSRLRLVNDHYEWRYWDDAGAWDKSVIEKHGQKAVERAEDTGHGSLDICFVLACAENGIVFTDADLKRFANTFVHVMWNGSSDKPTVGGWVNTAKPSRQSGNLQQWLLLGTVEPKVRPICDRLILTEGSLLAKAQLYWLWAAAWKEGRIENLL
jgi:hypothetical protein